MFGLSIKRDGRSLTIRRDQAGEQWIVAYFARPGSWRAKQVRLNAIALSFPATEAGARAISNLARATVIYRDVEGKPRFARY